MIVIRTFRESHQMYRQGRIPLRLLQDQASVLIGTCRNPHHAVPDPLDVTLADIDWLLRQPEASEGYAVMLGGYVHVCESEDDLNQIQGCDFECRRSTYLSDSSRGCARSFSLTVLAMRLACVIAYGIVANSATSRLAICHGVTL